MSDGEPTVLVVDDEPTVVRAYSMWLEDEYEVLTATSGAAALEQAGDADVVLLDRRMPEMTGDETLERLRDVGHDCWVVMVTAVDPSFDIVEDPFDAYLTKPVTKTDLRAAVERFVALTAYDEGVRELFTLASKRAAIDAQTTSDERAGDDAYAALTERIDEVNAEVERTVEQLDDDLFDVVLRARS